MDETKIIYYKKIPKCPNANNNSTGHHIVIQINTINEHSLNNFGITGKTAKEILETTGAFFECSYGLISRITKERQFKQIIKIEAQ